MTLGVSRDGTHTLADLWYPRLPESPSYILVGLIDVRAADDIRISYDFDRDGWRIEQATVFEWDGEADDCGDPGWLEVAFIKAWASQKAPPPQEGDP